MPTAIPTVLDHLAAHRDAAVDRLKALLAIPSVSTDPQYTPHIQTAARWVADQLKACGLEATIHPTAGHPAVVGIAPEHLVPDDAPTVLFYGHYDVQPPDPVDKWDSPPFEPTLRDNALIARGASDDKGQVCCFIEAVRAWYEATGKFPCRIKVLIEGEEEIGSTHLPPFIEAHRDELAADVVVISDTAMWDRQTVAITYGLRGLLYFDIQLHGPNRDLHSGVYGGTLANPATILTRVLGKLFDDNHRVTIPGFYDDVLPLSPEERQEWADLAFNGDAFLQSVGVSETYGEAGFELLERRWARPAVEVCGLYGGYMGQGAKTIIPGFAGAKVNFRLAPRQDPDRIAHDFVEWLNAQPVHGLTWKIEEFGRATPVVVNRNSPHVAAAARAITTTTGKPPAMVREGATIPVVADFKKMLGLDSLLIGFGLHDDRIHSPNEKFELSCFELGCRTHAALLGEIGRG